MAADIEDPVFQMLVIVETVNTIVLGAGLYLMYSGIEIGHPVYSILLCDLFMTFFSSLLNARLIVDSFPPYSLSNGNNLSCILLHCCFWCVLSALRYMFIINKDWLDKRFPKIEKLFILSLSASILMYSICLSTMLGTAMYFGYPEKKIMSLPLEQRLICLLVYMPNYAAFTIPSCTFYSLILRKRGKLGVSSVEAAVVFAPSQNQIHERPSTATSGDGISSISEGMDSPIRLHLKQIEDQKRLIQHEAEIQSAIISLKTNFVMTFIMLFIFLLGMIFSSDFLAVIFALLKGQVPLWTTVINFVKIQNLLQQLFDNLKEAMAAVWRNFT